MNSGMKRFTVIFAFSMAAIMALTLFLPAVTPNTTTQQAQQPTPIPEPTLPPTPDTAAISFDEIYLHPGGLFTVAQPTGWLPTVPTTTTGSARATFSNTGAQSIIQVDVERPALAEGEITIEDVDAQFSTAALESSWSRYSEWSEDRRVLEDDRLVMDFALTSGRQTLVSRQVAWTDGDWIYSVRVVVPTNAVDALLYLLDGLVESVEANKVFDGTPFDWSAYYDAEDNHIIRFPAAWTVADAAPGRPTSITGDGVTLRVQAQADTTISDEDAARAWVEDAQANAEVLSVAPVTRGDTDGFAVAYSFRTVDGEAFSGYVVLLNGPDGKLHSANLQFNSDAVDLNDETARTENPDLVQAMDTFMLMTLPVTVA